MMDNLLWVAIATLFLNVPFGYWRSRTRKFSLAWFIAIHAPVPVVAAMRMGAGIEWSLEVFPVLVAAYFAGQSLGVIIGKRARAKSTSD